jgi:chromosome segregation ATPase
MTDRDSELHNAIDELESDIADMEGELEGKRHELADLKAELLALDEDVDESDITDHEWSEMSGL